MKAGYRVRLTTLSAGGARRGRSTHLLELVKRILLLLDHLAQRLLGAFHDLNEARALLALERVEERHVTSF